VINHGLMLRKEKLPRFAEPPFVGGGGEEKESGANVPALLSRRHVKGNTGKTTIPELNRGEAGKEKEREGLSAPARERRVRCSRNRGKGEGCQPLISSATEGKRKTDPRRPHERPLSTAQKKKGGKRRKLDISCYAGEESWRGSPSLLSRKK